MIQLTIQTEQTKKEKAKHLGNVFIKNNWDQLTVGEFRLFVKKEKEAKETAKQLRAVIKNIPEGEKADEETQQMIDELNIKFINIRFDQLCAVAVVKNMGSYRKDNQKVASLMGGLSIAMIHQASNKLGETIGSFEDWFNKLPAVSQFRFKDVAAPKMAFMPKIAKTLFKVFPMPQTTLIRDTSAVNIAMRIQGKANEMIGGNYDLIPELIAYICRPAGEEHEFDVTNNRKLFRKKNAVVNGKEFAFLNAQDRLNYYTEQVKNVVDKRKDSFNDLGLGIAFGVYKQYFFLSTRQQKNIKIYTPN